MAAASLMTSLRQRAGFLNWSLLLVALFAAVMVAMPELGFAQEGAEAAAAPSLVEKLNSALDESLGKVNGWLFSVLFFDMLFGQVENVAFPLIVAVLILGGIFFTVWFKFINLRGIKHSIQCVMGKYDNPSDEGEVSHFRALTSALSATVGLGNIAGVAVAIQLGGPGAVFWMTVAGFLGMALKFTECTLGQMFRQVNPDGTISGGPMYYLDRGMKTMGEGFGVFGKALAVIFAFMVMGGAVGGGNMFQSNQSFEAIQFVFGVDKSYAWIYGVILAILVALVIIGGIKRIGAATSRIVPFMAGIYVLASMFIILTHLTELPAAFGTIIKGAFSNEAAYGGVVGILITGMRRAAFSNEAGLGSASIAHSAAKTKEPVREGVVALLEPFIDTIIICNMTALVIVITGVWNNEALLATLPQGVDTGVAMTKLAFQEKISWFPYILVVCVILFAYSTMISWCYYGERGWIYLMDHLGEGVGLKTVIVFRIIFVVFVYIGAVTKLGAVIDFSDAMILSMAFPNIVGLLILTPVVTRKVNDYWSRYKAGEFDKAAA